MTDEPGSSPADIEVAMLDATWGRCLPGAEALVCQAADRAVCHAIGERSPAAVMELSLVLTDDNQIRHMNRQHRGQDKPTNVLSFPNMDWKRGPGVFAPVAARELGPMPLLLGDVVIARETTVAEAAAQGKALSDHLAHLVVHGVLHLLGYDHETSEDAERMEGLEVTILEGLGVADPYQARPSTAMTKHSQGLRADG